MEKEFLDEIYLSAIKDIINSKELNGKELEAFVYDRLSEEKLQKYYKEAMNKFPEDILRYFLEICPEEYQKSQMEAHNYQKYLESIWQKGFELSKAMYLFVLEELEAYSYRLEKEHGDELENNKYKCKVLQLLANRNLQTFSAILTLIQNGFADQAFMLFRNMFENRVISEFVLLNNEETAKQFYIQQNEDIYSGKQREYEWAKTSGMFVEKSRVTFKMIYEKCMFKEGYNDIWYRQYRLACKLLHTTPQGTARTLTANPNENVMALVGQAPYGLNLAAEHSAIMLEETIKNYLCVFHDQSNLLFVVVMHKWVGLIQEVYYKIADSLQ